MKQPNFFIIGAPKCGTTAMFSYLADHPSVFMSDPKEPGFWCTDFPSLRRRKSSSMETVEEYLQLFERAEHRHEIVGEGSTYYLASTEAITNILQFNPESRFLVMLRNPIEFAPSYHHEKVYDTLEDVDDFEEAWSLQETRRQGNRIPPNCSEPELLQYRRMGAFGSQLARAFEKIPTGQLKVVLLDEFRESPRRAYQDVIRFLDLPDDGRVDFPRVNDAKTPRWRFLNRLYYRSTGPLVPLIRTTRRWGRRIPALRSMWRLARSRPQNYEHLSPAMRSTMEEAFADEIHQTSELLGRDLTHWMTATSAGEIRSIASTA